MGDVVFLASKLLVTLFGTVSGIDTRPNRVGDEAVEAYACFVGGDLDDGLLAIWNSDTNIVIIGGIPPVLNSG